MTLVSDKIILFDGVCNLCNGSVQFVLMRDHQEQFKFASLQSDFGQRVLKDHGLDQNDFNSFIYLRNGELIQKSSAALEIAKDLKNMWQLLYVFILVPKPIRDFVYSFIAQNRYKLFGQKESCMIPEKPVQHRFIQ
ncbi:MAG: thiol-disulfide oxidoreductase DCC family protein [Crocinitomicaceae bacterium]|nr:thiol-disulfide oxidoreductase DCC family protein [Crocinitomicaceae bacterium]